MGREGGPRVRPRGEAHPGLTPHGKARPAAPHVAQTALFRYVAAREARGVIPPPACGALWKVAQLGKCARATPRQAAGGSRQDPQASAWGPVARKGALWAEGLAEGAPGARSGHHQAASCGLRRCRELGLREFVWVAASLPWRRGGPHRPGNDAGVYTDRRNWPLGAVLGHSCTLLRCGLGLWVALGSQ